MFELELQLGKDDGEIETIIPVKIQLYGCYEINFSEEGICEEPQEETEELSTCQVSFSILQIEEPVLCEAIGKAIDSLRALNNGIDPLNAGELA